jgi:hypothetical protein
LPNAPVDDAVPRHNADAVVPVRKCIGADANGLSHGALDGEPSAIHGRFNILDSHAGSAALREIFLRRLRPARW